MSLWQIILSQSWPSPCLILLSSSFLNSQLWFCSFNIFSSIQCCVPASPFLTCGLVFLAFHLSTISLFPCTFSRALYLLCNDRTAGGKGTFLCCWKQQVSSLPSWGSLCPLLLQGSLKLSLLCSTGLGWSLALQSPCQSAAPPSGCSSPPTAPSLAVWHCSQSTAPTSKASAVPSPRERHQASPATRDLVCSTLPLELCVGQSPCCPQGQFLHPMMMIASCGMSPPSWHSPQCRFWAAFAPLLQQLLQLYLPAVLCELCSCSWLQSSPTSTAVSLSACSSLNSSIWNVWVHDIPDADFLEPCHYVFL